ncbi:unnamed protein product [Protopolystoma xenopodis]|uniref:Squalene/phytoene synthase n=1 Tax=Protopolystoma xenopodis TaxID=117903 RepID=A0A3S5B7U2_9PLAT|nr:unnamed protein product [Protopolystoma xenopodis]
MHRNLQFDYENYIGSIFLPHRLRNLALVVRLFDFQLSQSSELACSRYRFWREAIDRVYDDSIICNTPIEKALKKENHFALKPFDTLADLELYSDQTCSSILFILAQALGHASTDLDHALSHLGKSQGILRLVRGIVPLARLHRALILPTDLLCQVILKYQT